MSSESILFDSPFTITGINALKYDRVSRIEAVNASAGSDITLKLDINTELYPVADKDNISLCLASTLANDGAKDDGKAWRDIARGESTLADHYDYVMHGKVYRFEEDDKSDRLKAYVSFGGLLLYLEGPYKKLTSLRIDYVYLLMRKS